MLLNLTLTDYILVERLELALGPGFTVLTGETGAGKSILLDALGLILGERAEASVVRAGAQRAEVAAEFAIEALPQVQAWLAEAGLAADEGRLVLRRVVDAGGRSRAYVNGSPVTLQQLKELGEHLVDIHGQHAHYSLLRAGVQRAWLDAWGGCEALAARTAAAWRAWQQARRRLDEARQSAAQASSEREQLMWQVQALERLDFRLDQWQALLEEHRRLAHMAELIAGVQAVLGVLESEDEGVLARLHAARTRLEELGSYDAGLREGAAVVEDCRLQLKELARSLNRYAERQELDPEALAAAEARIAEVTATARRLRCTPEQLPRQLDEARERLARLKAQVDLDLLAAEASAAAQAYAQAAQALTACRTAAAASLGEAVSANMQQLAMQGGRFSVALNPCAADAGGQETVEFLVAPHAGQELRPLAKTASGGELSRIGLALQTVLAGRSGAPTLVFDEVDAGIGGAVAEVVGRLLARVAAGRQVLCVTHLPQVAAHARQHWRVVKEHRQGRATSRVEALSEAERVEEIARMLGGVRLTELTRRHARELLEQAAGS
ncbi:MAG: DNA repair protein RecN [Thiobacillaceae bacterium]|nr:DNA repair protein RecN [Thiobacillaceae bacterium]